MKDQDRDTAKQTGKPQTIELRTFAHEDESANPADGEELLERRRREQIDRIEAEEFWAGRNRATRRSGRIAA